ncbi:DUF4863 family protein [Streptomyces gramineus]|uniref:4-hydroxylaminobenzoate lyase n=1 Tax=Streptomyces gramineus TaxID=910542 RepID=UPI00398AE96C
MSTAQELVLRSVPFLKEVKNRTAGGQLENWLNANYGLGSDLYRDLARIVTDGVREGWAANAELDGPKYRLSRIAEPEEALHYFSVTAVYMNSVEPYRGQYHQHPYGVLSLIVPLNFGARLMGPNGWSGAGWTAPGPGSHHYPEVMGGALIALFYVPAGRISYDIRPPSECARCSVPSTRS